MKIISIITIFIALINNATSMKFLIDVQSNDLKCVGEYLIENTLALFSINSTSHISARLVDDNGNTVFKKEDQENIKVAYTAKDSGNHQMCISNNSPVVQRVEFEFLTGVAAQDYSSIAKQSNLKPMELNVSTVIINKYFYKD